MSASGGTVSGEGLECGETSDSDEESIACALLTSLSRSRTTLRARVATGGSRTTLRTCVYGLPGDGAGAYAA